MTTSLEPGLLAMMNETVVVQHLTGTSFHGGASYGDQIVVQCYIDRHPSETRGNEGRETGAEAMIYCNSDFILPTDLMLLDGEPVQISNVATYKDEHGVVHHQEVTVS